MKIWVYTLCYNEMKILPYIVNYWKQYADKVIVYDNGSTDGSIEFLKQFDFIEIRQYITDGFNDKKNKELKNNAWKEAKDHQVDFVQVSDLDEVLYSSKEIHRVCENLKANNVDVWQSHWVEVIGENLPTIINNDYYHKSEGFYGNDQGFANGKWGKAKFILFNPNTIAESNYVEGAHSANFIKADGSQVIYGNTQNDMYALHFDKLGLDYLQYKYAKNGSRLSSVNKSHGWGIHYLYDDDKKKKEIDKLMENKIDISNL